MKLIFKNFLPIIILLLVISGGTTFSESRLIGTWKMVNAKSNGISVPQEMTDRQQVFSKDKTFASKLNTSNGIVQINGGIYVRPNDTTLITYHRDLKGKLSTIANTYFFKIKNDTLHLYGNYLSPIKENPALLMKVFIDERWVRIKSK